MLSGQLTKELSSVNNLRQGILTRDAQRTLQRRFRLKCRIEDLPYKKYKLNPKSCLSHLVRLIAQL